MKYTLKKHFTTPANINLIQSAIEVKGLGESISFPETAFLGVYKIIGEDIVNADAECFIYDFEQNGSYGLFYEESNEGILSRKDVPYSWIIEALPSCYDVRVSGMVVTERCHETINGSFELITKPNSLSDFLQELYEDNNIEKLLSYWKVKCELSRIKEKKQAKKLA